MRTSPSTWGGPFRLGVHCSGSDLAGPPKSLVFENHLGLAQTPRRRTLATIVRRPAVGENAGRVVSGFVTRSTQIRLMQINALVAGDAVNVPLAPIGTLRFRGNEGE